jgi:hypothetical protein
MLASISTQLKAAGDPLLIFGAPSAESALLSGYLPYTFQQSWAPQVPNSIPIIQLILPPSCLVSLETLQLMS